MDKGNDTMVKLWEEGVKDVNELYMVDKDFLNQLTYNLKQSGGQMNVCGVMVATPAFRYGEISYVRLETVSNLLQF